MTILNKLKLFRPVGILFAMLTLLFLGSTSWLNRWGVDREVLMAGNIILLFVLADLVGNLHALAEELHEFIVEVTDLLSQCLQGVTEFRG